MSLVDDLRKIRADLDRIIRENRYVGMTNEEAVLDVLTAAGDWCTVGEIETALFDGGRDIVAGTIRKALNTHPGRIESKRVRTGSQGGAKVWRIRECAPR